MTEKLRIHYCQHVPFESCGAVAVWAAEEGHTLSRSALYAGEPLPPLDVIDMLVIMGGPMNIYEEGRYPWLGDEKRYIRAAIEADKYVLGICLGAQMIADVLGGSVFKNEEQEVGWFPVRVLNKTRENPLRQLPDTFECFHWHGDTFSVPEGACHCAKSKVCRNQAFSYNGGRTLALQFHLEMTQDGLARIYQECGNGLVDTHSVQTFPRAQQKNGLIRETHKYFFNVLNMITNTEQRGML